MRAMIQRVSHASVEVNKTTVSSINKGILLLMGFHKEDTSQSFQYVINKTINARIFNDEKDIMNKSLIDIDGELLVISQFTLYGDLRKGRRPSYSEAMGPVDAEKLYNLFIEEVKTCYNRSSSGIFGADMKVSLINDGPVTLMLDSTRSF